jgi:hypothetical protein
LCEFELRRALAIGVDGLLLVKINAICHQLVLYGYAMVMELMIDILLFIGGGPFRNGVAMTRLAFGMDDGITISG